VLAGILSHQAEEIAAIYTRWFEIDPLVESEGWTRVSGTRRAGPC
jgi:ribosomal protein L11 methyltransferase